MITSEKSRARALMQRALGTRRSGADRGRWIAVSRCLSLDGNFPVWVSTGWASGDHILVESPRRTRQR